MMRSTALRSLCLTASAAVMALGGTSTPACQAPTTGEINGIVQLGQGLQANAVVSLVSVPGAFIPPIDPVTLDQKHKEFEPHVLPVLKGTTIRFKNSDPYFHNIYSSSSVQVFNVSQKKGGTSDVTFDNLGLIPIRCHIHFSMKAFILVLPNPYFAVTNEKGQFHIANVPPGTYSLKVWAESGHASTQSVQVTVGRKSQANFKLVPDPVLPPGKE